MSPDEQAVLPEDKIQHLLVGVSELGEGELVISNQPCKLSILLYPLPKLNPCVFFLFKGL